jgi:hypothetical protein
MSPFGGFLYIRREKSHREKSLQFVGRASARHARTWRC